MAALDSFGVRCAWLAIGVLIAVGIVFGCLVPNPPGPSAHGVDKLEHALAMAGLTVWFGTLFPRRLWLVVLAVIVYGGLIELAQLTLTYRDASDLDWLADIVGVALGAMLVRSSVMTWLYRRDTYVGVHHHRPRNRR